MFKKIKRLNFFLVAVLALLGFSLFYFAYFSLRKSVIVYTKVSLLRPQNLLLNIPSNTVPYWIAQSIAIGDKDVSPLGGINAEVIGKDAFEVTNYGQQVNLILRTRATKAKSNVYLFRNKQLAVGSQVNLNLTNTQITGVITYVGEVPPDENYQEVKITVKGRLSDRRIFDQIKTGDVIRDSKGKEVAKIIGKTSQPADVRVNVSQTGDTVTYNQSRDEAILTLNVLAQKIDDTYYFLDVNKLKANEYLSVSFPSISLSNFQIIEVE